MARNLTTVSRNLFKEVFASGRSITGPWYGLKVVKNHQMVGKPIFSVVVSSKVAKKAVDRNKIKRQIRSILIDLRPTMTSGTVVIVLTKPTITKASFLELKTSIVKSLENSGIVSV